MLLIAQLCTMEGVYLFSHRLHKKNKTYVTKNESEIKQRLHIEEAKKNINWYICKDRQQQCGNQSKVSKKDIVSPGHVSIVARDGGVPIRAGHRSIS